MGFGPERFRQDAYSNNCNVPQIPILKASQFTSSHVFHLGGGTTNSAWSMHRCLWRQGSPTSLNYNLRIKAVVSNDEMDGMVVIGLL
jgi:hypothetical protein